MHTEDDTVRILKRDSFDTIIAAQAAYYGMTNETFFLDIASRILNGSTANEEWPLYWPGWTFEEARDEIFRRIGNDT